MTRKLEIKNVSTDELSAKVTVQVVSAATFASIGAAQTIEVDETAEVEIDSGQMVLASITEEARAANTDEGAGVTEGETQAPAAETAPKADEANTPKTLAEGEEPVEGEVYEVEGVLYVGGIVDDNGETKPGLLPVDGLTAEEKQELVDAGKLAA